MYYKILVAESTYHGKEALTYKSRFALPSGKVVTVPLKKQDVLGIIVGKTEKPSFTTKEVREVSDLPPLPRELLQLIYWMYTYYPAPLGIITQHFLPRALPKKIAAQSDRKKPSAALPPLTKDQKNALESITGPGLHLLYGATGTGKTRVYIELAKRQLRADKSSLILTPEIGLTSQLANDFRSVFGDKVKIIHSRLTVATRRKLWAEILLAKTPLIIIGPRSALFSPLHNLGLVVIDESHEPAYKQDQAPYYHASKVAAKLAELHHAALVLGSATPLVTDYYIAQAKKRPVISMSQTASTHAKATHEVTVIDHRDRASFTKNPYLSDKLIAGIGNTIDKNEQSLLFLNRRGTARMVFCDQCGWQALCPHCDLPLVYHSDTHAVRCHSCSYKTSTPASCPECGNPSVVFRSVGTKAITEEVSKIFPGAIVQRFDTDNKKAERIEEHYEAVRSGKVDIIVGTQTVAKGLDLPGLGLVGVLNADTGLSFPDYSASERTYQLLAQVLGRVGRGHRATQAIVQTYSPDSPILRAALTKNWVNFYSNEIEERKKFNFPPFCYLLKLTCRRTTRLAAEKAAQSLFTKLSDQNPALTIEGPAASFHEKMQDRYQWQLIVKSKSRSALTNIVNTLPGNWSYDIDPLNLL